MGVPLDPTMGLTAVVVCLSATAFVAVDSAQSIGHACEGEDTVTTTEYWECNWDGSDECTMVELDCTSGTETSGSVTYEANGLMHATGPGWDCRHKCRGKRGTSGSQKRTSHGSAGGGSSGGGSTPGGSFGGGSRPGGSGCPPPTLDEYLPRGDNAANSFYSSGPTECSARCSTTPACAAWTLLVPTNECWLKTSSVGAPGPDDEYMWGFPCSAGSPGHLPTSPSPTSATPGPWSGPTGEEMCEWRNPNRRDQQLCESLPCCHFSTNPYDPGFWLCWSDVGDWPCYKPPGYRGPPPPCYGCG